MKCLLVLAAAAFAASPLANREPRVLRGREGRGELRDDAQHTDAVRQNTTAPADAVPVLRADLLKWRWTTFVGDSVLLGQFLSLAMELGAKPEEPTLTQFKPCTEPTSDGKWPTVLAIMDLSSVAHEHLVTCTPAGCTFRRLGCLNLSPKTCTSICHEECTATDEGRWDNMLQSIQTTLVDPQSFVLSFHWAPSHIDMDKVMAKFPLFLPGKMLWNNCHHWFGATSNAAGDEPRLQMWLEYLYNNGAVLAQLLPGHVSFQGCAKRKCNPADHVCNGMNDWLMAMNGRAAPVLGSVGIPLIDMQPMLTDQVINQAFVDNRHPCYPTPCMWGNTAPVNAPRQCCANLLRLSFQQMDLTPVAGAAPMVVKLPPVEALRAEKFETDAPLARLKAADVSNAWPGE